MALPGFGDDALRIVAESRAWSRRIISLDDLAQRLPSQARATLFENYREVVATVSFQTSALVLTARGWVEGAREAETIEVLVVSGGHRMAVIQRRMW